MAVLLPVRWHGIIRDQWESGIPVRSVKCKYVRRAPTRRSPALNYLSPFVSGDRAGRAGDHYLRCGHMCVSNFLGTTRRLAHTAHSQMQRLHICPRCSFERPSPFDIYHRNSYNHEGHAGVACPGRHRAFFSLTIPGYLLCDWTLGQVFLLGERLVRQQQLQGQYRVSDEYGDMVANMFAHNELVNIGTKFYFSPENVVSIADTITVFDCRTISLPFVSLPHQIFRPWLSLYSHQVENASSPPTYRFRSVGQSRRMLVSNSYLWSRSLRGCASRTAAFPLAGRYTRHRRSRHVGVIFVRTGSTKCA